MKLEFDIHELLEFSERMSDAHQFETALMTATQNIARVLHQTILFNTPIVTGNLRKMWSAGENLMFTVKKVAGGYEVTLINTAQNPKGFMYGVAVNDGHKTTDGGWVMGRFFVDRSILLLEHNGTVERIIYNELDKWFRWCLNG